MRTAVPAPRRLLASVLLAMSCLSAAAAARDGPRAAAAAAPSNLVGTAEHRELMEVVLGDVWALKDSVWRFWACHGLDHEHGGFHGTLARDGTPVAPATKCLVQQARHVWAFSTLHASGFTDAPAGMTCATPAAPASPQQLADAVAAAVAAAAADGASDERDEQGGGGGLAGARLARSPRRGGTLLGREPTTSSRDMARSAYNFLSRHLRDEGDGGLYRWAVGRDGAPASDAKVLYGQWFAVYGLSAYAAAFAHGGARRDALAAFREVDRRWHDAGAGGYAERADNSIPPDDGAAPPDPEAPRPPRTLNALLHGVEALAELHRATGDRLCRDRLLELLEVLCTRLRRTAGGLLYEQYEPAPPVAGGAPRWEPAPSGSAVSYGHNLEAAWLVADTLDHLLAIEDIDPPLAATYRATAMAFGAAAARAGYDAPHGGVYELAGADGGPPAPGGRAKVWWVQAEAMLALCKLYEYDGRDPQWLRMLAGTSGFVRRFLNDDAHGGEQHWQVEEDGAWRVWGDLLRDTKGNAWKGSYHASRAPLFVERWMAPWLA